MSDLTSLLDATSATDPVTRGDAGQTLAAHAGSPAVDAVLVSLIQDPDNTYPTTQTALGLLARGDLIGIQVLARALAGADEDSTTHALDAMVEAIQSPQGHDRLLSLCTTASRDPDPAVRAGSAVLLDWFTQSGPTTRGRL